MSTQALAPKAQIANIRGLLEKSKDQIKQALPQHLTPERMIRIAMTAVQRTPKLLECTPLSIVGSVVIASQLGLEPDGILGRGFLIPRYNGRTKQMECTFMPGYLGLIDLAQRSGKVSWIAAELVYKCDKFEIQYGVNRDLIHIPDIDNPQRGIFDPDTHSLIDVRGAYSVVRYKDGATDFEYMPLAKLMQLKQFSQSKDSEYSPWNTAMGIEDMFRKCPIRKLAKRCPLSPEFQKAAQLEELAEAGIPQSLDAEIDPASAVAMAATNGHMDELANKYAPQEEAPDPTGAPTEKTSKPPVQGEFEVLPPEAETCPNSETTSRHSRKQGKAQPE